jgi:hypothetical protein
MKEITIKLGGQDRTLAYGLMGFYNHVAEATNKDPFEWISSLDEKFKKRNETNAVYLLAEDLVVIVYAGLNTHLDIEDKPNIPLESVKKWCNGLSPEQMGHIVVAAFGTEETVESGEAVAQP